LHSCFSCQEVDKRIDVLQNIEFLSRMIFIKVEKIRESYSGQKKMFIR